MDLRLELWGGDRHVGLLLELWGGGQVEITK